jgi:alpha-D-ribose 1-methylphosphonate 5-triphosphate synthase subunit PhnG
MSDAQTAPFSSMPPDPQARRQNVMAVLAEAEPGEIARLYEAYTGLPKHETVRSPETGLVMVRGRMGGTGSPFNLGEVTVTRCVVRLTTGETGSSYILGRHKTHALQAALFDALWQHPDHCWRVEESVIAPLAALRDQQRDEVKAETAATKVDFFTMVRGDD